MTAKSLFGDAFKSQKRAQRSERTGLTAATEERSHIRTSCVIEGIGSARETAEVAAPFKANKCIPVNGLAAVFLYQQHAEEEKE